ncbi:MAG: polysaccharide biosynthesis tyrosine autokinase [Isosphaeraceae bacterium]
MDTQDTPNSNLPIRLPAPATRLPAPVSTSARELVATPSSGMTVDPRSLMRGLTRNWWRILLIWLVVSAPVVFLIYKYVEPTYQAFSQLLVESNQPELFGASMWNHELTTTNGPIYLQTQIEKIRSDKLLDEALDKLGDLSRMTMFRDVVDPKTELRKKLDIQIIPNTHWIQVALESRDPVEAANVVNAIVNVFEKRTADVSTNAAKRLRTDLAAYKKTLDETITKTKKDILELAKKGNFEYSKPVLNSKDPESDQVLQPSFEKLSLEQYRSAKDKLFQTDIQLMELEAQYQARRSDAASNPEAQAGVTGAMHEQLREQIVEEFRRDPAVASLVDEIKATTEELEHTKGVVKKGADPARVAAHAKLRKLNDEYNDLWATKSEQIRRRLLVPTSAPELQSTVELKRKIDELKLEKVKLAEMINTLKQEEVLSHEDTVKGTFLHSELAQYQSRYEQVDRKLEQLNFTQDKGTITIEDKNPAQVPKSPYNNKRWKYMAMVPLAVLFAVLALFLLLEVKSERVANPDMLSSRVRSEVFALPPLPTRRTTRKLDGPVVDDQIDRFIQRLDHLRFAVCGNHRETDLGRCLLVTSAIGGEGKTTLAAQLAARCGNAGISTVLIDADLRRAALSPLLDVPESPGLSDVLNEGASLDEAVIPLQGGSFCLLPAGSSVQDTTSILQGRSLALLIAELRKRYELIIIDSPPVLPVPDALILGRWTDGALLAARFEVSRSPQVERARKQLDAAGIAVLGTVINGMQSADTYYGRYTYGRYRSTRGGSSRGA